jgi:small subunit ribosomal protein S1
MDNENQELHAGQEGEESFEELLNQSSVQPVHFQPGEKIEAAVIKITQDWVFIDIGGKTEGTIATDEFHHDDDELALKEGSMIEAFFLSSQKGEMLFTTRIATGASKDTHLEEAYHSGIPVEGLVEKEVKGGFQVKLAGNKRAFCPYSQLGPHQIEEESPHIGNHLTFKIIEYGAKGRNIVLSHKAILEEERRMRRDALKGYLKEGMTVGGEVTSVRDFGAFVDIGGIEGLVPVSELSWGRVDDLSEIISVGQKVDVAIMKLDWDRNRFSFSLKENLPDPWGTAVQRYPEGSIHTGKVARLAPFGAFVTLEPGIDGLIHISELGRVKRIKHPHEVLQQDQSVEVKILQVDEEKRRLSLSLFSENDGGEETENYQKHLSDGDKKSGGGFGTLGDLLRGKMDTKDS